VAAGLGMLVVGAGGTPMLNGGGSWVTGPLVLAGLVWFVASGRARAVVGEVNRGA